MDSMFGYTFLQSLAPKQRGNFNLLIDADSDFLVEKVYSNENGSFLMQVLDTTTSYQWFSDRVMMENFFGTAEYPNELPTPILLKRGTQLNIDLENLWIDPLDDPMNPIIPNNIELVFEGYRVQDDIPVSKKRYFAYVMNVNTKAQNRTIATMSTNSDTDFVANRYIAWNSLPYSQLFKLSLSSLAARQMYSQFTTVENAFGTVLRPNNLRHPLTIPKNSVLKYEISNNSTLDQSLQLVLDGMKVWS